MAINSGQTSVLLEKVLSLVDKKVSADHAQVVHQFVEKLYGNMSLDDLVNRNDSDLYGAALSLWQALSQKIDDETFIKVYNPEIEKHGWHSAHTVIEIVVKDMPFLVDSVRMALNRLGVSSHLLLHSPIKYTRNKSNEIEKILAANSRAKVQTVNTVFFIEIDRQSDAEAIEGLTQELHSVVEDVSLSVNDWKALVEKLQQVTQDLSKRPVPEGETHKNESIKFLNWLTQDNFTFMGYRSYDLKAIKGDYILEPNDDSSLGLMRRSTGKKGLKLSSISESARDEALSSGLLMLTKTNSKSRVHRPANIDYIGIKRFDENGNVVGEDRFVGLYSSNFYNSSATDIAFLNIKIDNVLSSSGFAKGSHAYKALLNILETYPRDELIQATESQLRDISLGILQMQERNMTKVFIRKDPFGRFYSCMVFVPRERYNTQLRIDTQKLLANAFDSKEEVEFTTFFSESVLARTHYVVHVNNKSKKAIDVKAIEDNLIEAARTWDDRLQKCLTENKGESEGKKLNRKYSGSFSPSYREDVLPASAVVDIEKLESLKSDSELGMLFYRPQEEKSDSQLVKLKLFHLNEPIHLSDVLPMLENFGLRVIGERPYRIQAQDGKDYWILDFQMLNTGTKKIDMEQAQALFQDALEKVWNIELEDDGFNRLILGAGLNGRQVSILRAYAKYKRQIGGTFSQSYIEETFAKYSHIAELLIELFERKFNPKLKPNAKAVDKLVAQIHEQLDNVANLDDDRIIRRYVDMIQATLRTNFYQKADDGSDKSYISIKLQPELIPEIPLPVPKFEIFVYSPKIEGVHLRGGKVARGGLRWSDRKEDFRTEVLGLVKAQQVKNTVIVPVGSKGGFVCKQLPTERQAMLEEGQNCYRTFIRGLLDITDNIDKGEIVPPQDVVRLDEDDPYLVVAADKGTATFSDIANEISESYGFWLGDAFASGGSVGYDHKKMGITARGAWESVKRNFREIGIDCQTTDFTCIAVGDMAGDVFGNGMLLSKHTCLQVAFNHMHIFIDPTPNAAKSYKERERLFNLPRSSWEDYDAKLISEGGGIFSRAAKSIKLTPQIKKMLGVQKATMAPNDLIKAVLMMKVDLFWNGGIGTYVKAKTESHADVGDRANDALRINGEDMKARIVGEGGNLGLTQRGRIEYALSGGRVNTDFVDNVGGVDCSDNEVNIKILLNQLVAEGELTVKKRNAILYDMTDDVGDIVIEDCYRQTQSISITELRSVNQVKEQIRFIHALERDGYLNRELEFLPTDDEIYERQGKGNGFTRPELSVLLAYGKMVLKEQFVHEDITQNAFYQDLLINSFPPQLRETYSDAMANHPLRGEIIATKLANKVINDMGLNYVQRMQEETGASVVDIAYSYSMASHLFKMDDLWVKVEKLDNKISADVQNELLFQLRRNVRRASRWFLRHRNKSLSIAESIKLYTPVFNKLDKNLANFLMADEMAQINKVAEGFVSKGVPAALAKRFAELSTLFSAMDITQIVEAEQQDPALVCELYYNLGSKMELHWFLDQITMQPVTNHWQALARASYREELDWQQRSLTAVALRYGLQNGLKDMTILDEWLKAHESLLERWYHVLAEFKTTKNHEFAKFSVALRELMLLSHNCDTGNIN